MRSLPDSRRSASAVTGAFMLLVVLLLALRAPHLAGPLDDPHSWRQCDTITTSREFARHGIDLLRPSFAWLGHHRHMIFEFPLPEALAALLHRAFGFDPAWDRLVSLGFFVLSLVWLHRLARLLTDEGTARFTAFAYLLLPLGQFYSRAATVDFAAQAFATGFLYHGLLALRGRHGVHMAVAAACGILASWLKVPYLLPVMFPFLLAAVAGRRRAPWTRAFVVLAGVALGFAWWRARMNALNAAAPDWSWLPGYYKEVDPWWFYARQFPRLVDMPDLLRLARRLVAEVFTTPGLVMSLFALGWRPAGDEARSAWLSSIRRQGPGPLAHALAWLAGFAFFSLLFLPIEIGLEFNQIPILAPVSLLIALGGMTLLRWAGERRMLPAMAVAMMAFPLVALVTPSRLHWYRVDELRVQAGTAIEQRVPPGDLVVAVDHSSDFSDPRLLTRADRMGFAVRAEHLTPALLARLEGVGARWVAWISRPGEARLAPPAFLAPREVGRERLVEHGAEIGTLHLYALAPADSASRGLP